jgi:hypothetical protein
MTRDELITAIRAQTDLDEEDLPLEAVIWYLREAFYRTAAVERRWPTHEADWEYIIAPEGGLATLAADTAEISAVQIKGTTTRLIYADHDVMRTVENLGGTTYTFSLWGGKMYVWPAPSEDTTFVVSGYRKPSATWLNSPSVQVDLDERLHIPLLHYAVALAYAQQEDGELEDMYMRRWSQNVNEIRDSIMKGNVYRPIVLNGGLDQQRF